MKIFNRVVGVLVSVVLALMLAVWILSPALSRWLLADVLEEKGLVLEASSSIRINPFASKLTVNDLAWDKGEQTVFQVDQLSVNYSLWRLIKSEVFISEFVIDGVYAKVRQDQDEVEVLGWPLAGQESSQPALEGKEATQSEQPGSEGTSDLNIRFRLNELKISNVQVYLSIDGQTQVLALKQHEIKNLIFDAGELSGESSTFVSLNQLDCVACERSKGSEGAGDERANALPDVSMATKLSFSFKGELFSAQSLLISDIDFSIADLQFNDGNYNAELKRLALVFPELELSFGEQVSMNTTARFEMNELSVNQSGELALMSMAELLVPELSLNFESDLLFAKLEKLELTEVDFLTLNNGKGEALSQFQALMLDGITFEFGSVEQATKLNVDLVRLTELNSRVEVNSAGEIPELASLIAQDNNGVDDQASSAEEALSQQQESTSPEIQTESVDEPAFTFNVARFELGSDAIIKVKDNSVSPSFDKTFTIEELNLSNISNQDPNTALTFNALLKDQNYLNYELSGQATPFSEKLDLSVKSLVSEFSLHEVSPYLNDALGFSVEAGQLDSETELEVVQDVLSGKVKVNLRGAKFAAEKNKQEEELDFVGKTAIPLNVALNMLKDGDGNINLVIPLDGDINDPSFGVQYIIGLVVKKAVMSQTKKHLINTFVPYGQVLSVAYAAGSYALKVRFEDLAYQPLQQDMGQRQIEYAQQFATLLEAKDDMQVRICPVAAFSELGQAETVGEKNEQKLIEIAKERAALFKRHVTKLGIDSSRLLICTPEIDRKGEAVPRIEFSI